MSVAILPSSLSPNFSRHDSFSRSLVRIRSLARHIFTLAPSLPHPNFVRICLAALTANQRIRFSSLTHARCFRPVIPSICVCIHTQRHAGAHMHLFAYTHMFPCVHSYTHTQSHACTHTDIHSHAYTHSHAHTLSHGHILTPAYHQAQTPLPFLDASRGSLPRVSVPAGMDQYLSFAAGPCCPVCPQTFVPKPPYVRVRIYLRMLACMDVMTLPMLALY